MYHILENCTGCTACAKLCPVSAITGERNQLHAINEKRCIECGVCGRICPKGAITDGSGTICNPVPRAKWEKPDIDKGRCTACGICVFVCRAKALRIAMPVFKGDIHVAAELYEPKKCVGCALCSLECPIKIIIMKGDVEK